MKLGIVARAEDRGLGHLTYDFASNLDPDRVLVVEMGDLARGFPPHLDRYPGSTLVAFRDGQLDEGTCREFLRGLDVVYLAETPYDYRFFDWARDEGARTVLHVMPEFWRWDDPTLPRPDAFVLPTSWRRERLPLPILPVPPPTPPPDLPAPPQDRERPLRVVHVVGHRAHADRNGTVLVLQSLRGITSRLDVRLVTQDDRIPAPTGVSPYVNLSVVTGGFADRWDLYRDADVLLLPRRYGGLCLPALEAMAAGVVPVMSDASPQNFDWPVVTVPSYDAHEIRTAAGKIRSRNAKPGEISKTLSRLNDDRDLYLEARARTAAWVEQSSWDACREPIRRVLYEFSLR